MGGAIDWMSPEWHERKATERFDEAMSPTIKPTEAQSLMARAQFHVTFAVSMRLRRLEQRQ